MAAHHPVAATPPLGCEPARLWCEHGLVGRHLSMLFCFMAGCVKLMCSVLLQRLGLVERIRTQLRTSSESSKEGRERGAGQGNRSSSGGD